MKKTNRKISIFEIVWYSVMAALAIWGLTFIVLGVMCRYLPDNDGLIAANDAYASKMHGGFLKYGMIILPVAALLAVLVLLINAKTADREVEKQQRRAARLAAANEVKSEPVEE